MFPLFGCGQCTGFFLSEIFVLFKEHYVTFNKQLLLNKQFLMFVLYLFTFSDRIDFLDVNNLAPVIHSHSTLTEAQHWP